jgi:hypothetical protein
VSELKDYLECNAEDFLLIKRKVVLLGSCAFDFCPNESSKFGVVLTQIGEGTRLTRFFSGLHPSLVGFLFVSIERHGGFGFIPDDWDCRFHIKYVAEKLNLPHPDAKGFCDLLNFLAFGDTEKT